MGRDGQQRFRGSPRERWKAHSFGLLLSLSSGGLMAVPVKLTALPHRFFLFFHVIQDSRIVISPILYSLYSIYDLESSRSNRFRNSERQTSNEISSSTLVNAFSFNSSSSKSSCPLSPLLRRVFIHSIVGHKGTAVAYGSVSTHRCSVPQQGVPGTHRPQASFIYGNSYLGVC